jgi:hypothetical protein
VLNMATVSSPQCVTCLISFTFSPLKLGIGNFYLPLTSNDLSHTYVIRLLLVRLSVSVVDARIKMLDVRSLRGRSS